MIKKKSSMSRKAIADLLTLESPFIKTTIGKLNDTGINTELLYIFYAIPQYKREQIVDGWTKDIMDKTDGLPPYPEIAIPYLIIQSIKEHLKDEIIQLLMIDNKTLLNELKDNYGLNDCYPMPVSILVR